MISRQQSQENQPIYAMYTVKTPIDVTMHEPGKSTPFDLDKLELDDTPFVTSDDVISYNPNTNMLQFKLSALERIPKNPDFTRVPIVISQGIPFVVVANGERIYLAAFWASESSMMPTVPTVIRADWATTPGSMRVDPTGVYFPIQNDPRLKEALKSKTLSPEKAVQAQSEAQKQIAREKTLPDLYKLLDDPDANIRRNAVQWIFDINTKSTFARAALINALKDPSPFVQDMSAHYLMNENPTDIALIRAWIEAVRRNANLFSPDGSFHSIDDSIVSVSHEFADRFGPEQRDAVADLTSLAHDPHPGVQEIAVTALTHIGDIPEELVPMLMNRLRESASVWAQKALVKAGPKARAAVPGLVEMIKDPHGKYPVSAIRTLDAIDPDALEQQAGWLVVTVFEKPSDTVEFRGREMRIEDLQGLVREKTKRNPGLHVWLGVNGRPTPEQKTAVMDALSQAGVQDIQSFPIQEGTR